MSEDSAFYEFNHQLRCPVPARLMLALRLQAKKAGQRMEVELPACRRLSHQPGSGSQAWIRCLSAPLIDEQLGHSKSKAE